MIGRFASEECLDDTPTRSYCYGYSYYSACTSMTGLWTLDRNRLREIRSNPLQVRRKDKTVHG